MADYACEINVAVDFVEEVLQKVGVPASDVDAIITKIQQLDRLQLIPPKCYIEKENWNALKKWALSLLIGMR